MKVKNAIKKVVALGAGAIMLGATVMGAAAADLGDYPSPFVKSGVFSGKIVVGEAAATSDLLGALDIAASLQRAASTPVAITGTGVSVSDGDTEEVPLGSHIANGFLDSDFTDSDLSVLQDTSVRIQGTNYDFHDEIQLVTGQTLTPATSLSSSEDDYEEGIFFELQRNALKYCFVFDESINLSEELGTASDNYEMEVSFLGANLRAVSVPSATSIRVIAGREVFLNAGDSTVSEGKTVTLDRTSNSAAVITVDGSSKVIDVDEEFDFGGLNVQVENVFNDDGIEYDSATLIIGADTEETFSDGDKFIGEPDNDYEWEWDLAGLTALGSGTDQTLCVQNTKDYEFDSKDEGPLGPGEYYSYPNDFVEVGIDSLTVADDNYMNFDVEYDATTDLSDAVTAYTSEDTFTISVSEEEGITLSANIMGLGSSVKTDAVYIRINGTENVEIYYDDTDNDQTYAGYIATADTTVSSVWGQINYDKTKTTDVQLYFYGNASTADDLHMGLLPLVPTNDAIWMNFGSDGSDFDGLGVNAESKDASELLWGNTSSISGTTTLGTKDENHRTKYGIIVYDPENNGDNDEVKLDIPGDQVKANAVLRSGGAAVGGGSAGTYDKINPISVGMGLLDADATNLGGSTPYLVVGGPCANTVAAELLGNAANCAEGFEVGKAKVKWFETENAMLVAGYNADDTVGASRVVANYQDFDDGFAAGITEFEVLTPSLENLQIRTIV